MANKPNYAVIYHGKMEGFVIFDRQEIRAIAYVFPTKVTASTFAILLNKLFHNWTYPEAVIHTKSDDVQDVRNAMEEK